jgi:oligopeptide/dipeptide ABC transporter ATP-binding protein
MLLSVKDLCASFFLDEGELRVVDGVSFDIEAGQTLGVVGESGCGKTIVALALLDLIPSPGGVVGGEVLFEGRDLRAMAPNQLRRIRGAEIGLVFQEPAAALNPVYSIGRQLSEVLQYHRGLGRREAWREAVKALGDIGIPEPEARARSYPFQLSGGMKQRALIAIATAGRPKLLIADEPTTALDVTVQAEILELLAELQAEHEMAILLISHDLEMVSEMAEEVVVMYTGRVAEAGPTRALIDSPRHPYTQGLLGAIPKLGSGSDTPLVGIPGSVPDLLDLPSGCTFHPRCELADETCSVERPSLIPIGRDVRCACFKAEAEG